MAIWDMQNAQLTTSVEVPFGSKPKLYWAEPSEESDLSGHSYWDRFGGLVKGVAGLGATFISPVFFGKHPGTFWFKKVRWLEEFASPFGILSTFRIGESLSALVKHPQNFTHNIPLTGLTTKQRVATANYLRHILNVKESLSGFKSLKFLADSSGVTGQLFGVGFNKTETLLASGVRTMRPGRLFESFTSVVQPGLYGNVATSRAIFGGIENTRLVPIPSRGTLRDIVTGFRSYAAFSVQRLAELMERVGEELKIPFTDHSVKSLIEKIGLRTSVKRGPAVRTLFSYAGIAGAVGIGMSVLNQIDAFRVSGSVPERAIGVGLTGAAGFIIGSAVSRGMQIPKAKGGLIGLGVATVGQFLGFDEGIIPGTAGLVAKANLLRSKIGEVTGLNTLRRWTERTFPGSTGIGTAAYMGLLGGIGSYLYARHIVPGEKLPPLFRRVLFDQGSIYSYARKVQLEQFGMAVPDRVSKAVGNISSHYRGEMDNVVKEMLENNAPIFTTAERYEAANVARRIQGSLHKKYEHAITSGNLFRRTWQKLYVGAKLGRLGSIWGPAFKIAGIWGLSSIGTLETPDELEKIYSGEQLVPVRRGRYWEGGRTPYEGCLTPESKLILSDGTLKSANNIKVGDKLINIYGSAEPVIGVLPRNVNENIYTPITSFDQNGFVSLTGNHEVSVVVCNSLNIKRIKNPKQIWMPISTVPTDGKHRLFIPYYKPKKVIESIYLPDYVSNLYYDSEGWFYRKESIWSGDMDDELLTIGSLPRRSKQRAVLLKEFLEFYNLTSSQARYRLNDLRRKDRNTGARKHYISGLGPVINLDREFGKVCGLYAAKGSSISGGRCLSFAFHKEETSYINFVKDFIHKKFNIEGFTVSQSDNGVSLQFNNSLLVKVFEGLVPGTVRHGDKRVHPDLINFSSEFLYGFIDGVIKGDGSIHEKGSVRIGMKPVPLLKQLQLILLRLHIFSVFSKQYENSVDKNTYGAVELRIPNASAVELNQIIPIKDYEIGELPAGERQYGYIKVEGGFGVTLLDMKISKYCGTVYDFQVKEGDSFVGSGFTMHNSDILYWRQHWLPRLKAKARVRSRDPWSIGFIKENFTYEVERENYYNRPYPITGAAFDEVPFIGPIIRPLADLIKPPRLMHVSDWARVNEEGNLELRYLDKTLVPAPSQEMGGIAPGAPVSPYSLQQSIQEIFYESTELAGLVGWASGSIYAGLTGAQMPFDNDLVLRSATDIESSRRAFWSEQSGGALFGLPFMSEVVRRFLPAYPSIVQKYNPIPNRMPDWFPEDFKTGDPFTELLYGLGEERLPGPLYEELYNVQGKYSHLDKMRILADTAYWSREFRSQKSLAQRYSMSPDAEPEITEHMNMILSNLALKKEKIPLDYYRTMSSGYGFYDAEGNLHDVNEGIKAKGAIASLLGRPWEKFIHTVGQVTSPVEHIIPAGFSPWAKLVSMYDPVEHYEMNQVYGQQYKFWSNPWENWFRPAYTSMKRYWLGDKDIPDHIQDIRNTQEYYDKLKWLKYQRLAIAARAQGKSGLAGQYQRVAGSTSFGANPFGGESQLKYALSYSDRAYFDPFSMAISDEARSDIMRIIPHQHREIYQGIWANRLYKALKRQSIHGEIDSDAQATLERIEALRATEGKPYSEEMWASYIDKAPDGMKYSDWHRMKEAEAFFATNPLPGPQWIGWNPAVDLEDIKLKQIQEEGKDFHDYDMFQSRVNVLSRKPYLNKNWQPNAEEEQRRLNNQLPTNQYNRLIRGLLAQRGLLGGSRMDYNFLGANRSTPQININAGIDTSVPLGYLLSN